MIAMSPSGKKGSLLLSERWEGRKMAREEDATKETGNGTATDSLLIFSPPTNAIWLLLAIERQGRLEGGREQEKVDLKVPMILC